MNPGQIAYLITKQLEPYYDHAEKPAKIILQHCGIAGALALIPLGGFDVAAVTGNMVAMAVRLNPELGLSLQKDSVRIIVKYMFSMLLSNLSALPIAFIGGALGSLVKFIPGIGTALGMLITPASFAAMTYVFGIIYARSLLRAARTGNVSEESVKAAVGDEFTNKGNISSLFNEAKDAVSGIDFSQYRDCASSVKLDVDDDGNPISVEDLQTEDSTVKESMDW